jgi:hypothetical protein
MARRKWRKTKKARSQSTAVRPQLTLGDVVRVKDGVMDPDYEQIPENLSRKGCAPIIGEPRGVTWGAYIFVVVYSGDHYHADPQTALL